MKIIKRLFILILIIILLFLGLGFWIYRNSQHYIVSPDQTTITMSRYSKKVIRQQQNKIRNAGILQLLQNSYNILHNFNVSHIQKKTQIRRQHIIQTEDKIIGFHLSGPSILASSIKTQNIEDLDGIHFLYKEQIIGSIRYLTQEQIENLEEEQLNTETLYTDESGVIFYSQILDNPFTGMDLEIFGEMVQVFQRSISTFQIDEIKTLSYLQGKIISISTGDNTTLEIEEVILHTGEQAAIALSQEDPELCQSILSGTDETLCFPPNDYYISIISGQNTTHIEYIQDEEFTSQIHIITTDSSPDTESIELELFIQRVEQYPDAIFDIQLIDSQIKKVSQIFLP